MYQHSYDCKDINRNKTEKTALAHHHFATNHNFDFSKVTILDHESHFLKRNVSEMIHISLNNTVNCRTDTQGLNVIYSHILNLFKQRYDNN